MYASRLVSRTFQQSFHKTINQTFRRPQTIASIIRSRTFTTQTPINQSNNQSNNQSTNQSTEQPIDQSIKKSNLPRSDPGFIKGKLRTPPPINHTITKADPGEKKDWFDSNIGRVYGWVQNYIKFSLVLIALWIITRAFLTVDTPLLQWVEKQSGRSLSLSNNQSNNQTNNQTNENKAASAVTK